MATEEIKVGDIVKVKSGGPKMTVESITNDTIFCKWFVKKEVREEFFERLMLQICADKK